MQPERRKRFRQIFLTHLGRVKWRLFMAALFTVGVAATDLLKPWPLKIILDHGILDNPLPQALGFLQGVTEGGKVSLVVASAIAIVMIAVCEGLLSYFQIFITSSVGYRLVYSLRRELFAHLQRLSLSFHNRAKSGDLLNRIASDTNTLKDVFSEDLLKFSAHLLTVIGMFAIISAKSWKISLIAFATLRSVLSMYSS